MESLFKGSRISFFCENMKHLYRYGAKKKMLREFKKRYGKRKGVKVYYATIGKVKREMKKRKK